MINGQTAPIVVDGWFSVRPFGVAAPEGHFYFCPVLPHQFLFLLHAPTIGAILTDANGLLLVQNFLSLGCKNCNNEGREGEEQPPEGKPPPANEQPPQNAVMLVFYLHFVHNSYIYIFTATPGTFHNVYLFSIMLEESVIPLFSDRCRCAGDTLQVYLYQLKECVSANKFDICHTLFIQSGGSGFLTTHAVLIKKGIVILTDDNIVHGL